MATENSGNERQKRFHDLSIVGQFHNAPKIFGERVEYPFIEDLNVREIQMQTIERVNNLTNNKEALTSSDGLHLYKVMKAAIDTSLNPEAQNDPEENKNLPYVRKKSKNILLTY